MIEVDHVEVIAVDLGFTEGPVALPDGFAVCSITHNCVYLLVANERPRQLDVGGGPNGMTIDADGHFYVAQNGGAWGGQPAEAGIQRIVGDQVHYLATGLDAPNDVCFGADGRLYFSDPGRDGRPRDPRAGVAGRLYSCNSDGSDLSLLHEGTRFTNGLAFTPADDALMLVETATRQIHRFPWRDGDIGEPAVAIELAAGAPDGLAYDTNGFLWVAATRADAIFVFDPDGDLAATIEAPMISFPTNLCFGGPDMTTLCITCGTGVVVRCLANVAGLSLHPRRATA